MIFNLNLLEKIQVDFIAHHEIQLQSLRAIYDELSKIYKCNILIGQDAIPNKDSNVAIITDHCAFQPNVNKKNYSFIIHVSHDLADWDLYKNEMNYLSEFDLILVPGKKHLEYARKYLPNILSYEVGWSKSEIKLERILLENNKKLNIIYAPTSIGNREWESLLPELLKTSHNILIKNHIYYDFECGALPPKGCEIEYSESIKSLKDMEYYLSNTNYTNFKHIDRRSNLCELFQNSDLLITDCSSASLEFISYGPSIETGRFGINERDTMPYASKSSKHVKYYPLKKLKKLLQKENFLVNLCKKKSNLHFNQFITSIPIGSGNYASFLIDLHLFLFKKNLNDFFYDKISNNSQKNWYKKLFFKLWH